MTRAERRRQMREQGYRRAEGKRGRRPAIRSIEFVPVAREVSGRLALSGFQVVTAQDILRAR